MFVKLENVKEEIKEQFPIETAFLRALGVYRECESYFFITDSIVIPFSKTGDKFISVPFVDVSKMIINKLEGLEKLRNKRVILKTSDRKIVEKCEKINFLKKIEHKQHILMNLKNLEETWLALHKHARNDIRRAIRNNLFIREISDENSIREFYHIYANCMREFCSLPHSLEFFKKLLGLKNVVGFNCYRGRKCIASIIEVLGNESGYIAFNVSTKKFRKLAPNDLLYWHCIKFSVERGLRKIDLGEVEVKTTDPHAKGILHFKKKYGNFIKQKFLLTNFNFEMKKEKKFRKFIEFIPTFILRHVGPNLLIRKGI